MDRSPANPPSRRLAALANVLGMGANTLVVSVQALILVPVYLQVLGTRLYGAWLGSGEILNFLQLFDLGLTNVVTQRIGAAHARGDRQAVAEYFGSAVVALSAVGLVLSLLAVAVSFFVAHWMGLSGAEAALLRDCFRLGGLATFLFVANFSVLGLARGTQDTMLQNIGTVAGTLTGFATSLGLVFTGAGLWAIVAGMCARTAVVLGVSVVYVWRLRARGRLGAPRVTRRALVDFARLSPATTLAGIGHLLTTQTEAALVGGMLGPERVPVLMLTRRAIDVAGGLLHTFSYSAYAGFAHLVDSPHRDRAHAVKSELDALWMSLALAAVVGYLAANHSLVGVWAGPAYYGGAMLTVLLAAQMVVAGRLQLLYYLYRASGAIVPGSMVQFWESLIRFGAMVLLLPVFGLPGPAVATIGVGLVASVLVSRRLRAVVPATGLRDRPRAAVFVARALLAAAGVAGCLVLYQPTWAFALAVGSLGTALAAVVLMLVDPRLREARLALGRAIRGRSMVLQERAS